MVRTRDKHEIAVAAHGDYTHENAIAQFVLGRRGNVGPKIAVIIVEVKVSSSCKPVVKLHGRGDVQLRAKVESDVIVFPAGAALCNCEALSISLAGMREELDCGCSS